MLKITFWEFVMKCLWEGNSVLFCSCYHFEPSKATTNAPAQRRREHVPFLEKGMYGEEHGVIAAMMDG
jgi:hypothetical protein